MNSQQTQEETKAAPRRMLFFYVPSETPFTRIHPLARIAIGLTLDVLPFVLFSFVANVAIILLALLLLGLARVERAFLLSFSRLFIVIAVTIFIAYGLFGGTPTGNTGTVIFHWGIITIATGNLVTAVVVFSRWIAAVFGILFILATCSERDYIKALGALRLPQFFTFIVAVAIRGLSTFYDDYMMVLEAQKARGSDIDNMSLINKAKTYAIVLIPLILVEFARAEEMANAMDSRSYSPFGAKRTDYVSAETKLKSSDYALVVLCVMLFVAVFLFRNSLENLLV